MFTTLDVGVIVVYFLLILYLGYYMSKRIQSSEDALVAGKKLPLLANAASMGANIAGGATAIGGGGNGHAMGITAAWFGIATATGGLVFAPFAARIKRLAMKLDVITLGDLLESRYNKLARVISGLLNAVAFAGFVASQIVVTGVVLNTLLGWEKSTAMILTTVIIILYTTLGGLWAVAYTDLLQILIIIGGFCFFLMPRSLSYVGGWSALTENLPATFFNLGQMGAGPIVAQLMAAGLTVFVGQSIYSYTVAAKNPSEARDARWLSSVIYIFPAIAAVIVGMAARVALPDIASSAAIPSMIGVVLPSGLAGLMLAAIIAATMSTSDTCLIVSVTSVMRDFYEGFYKPNATAREKLVATRVCTALVGVLALIIGWLLPHIIPLILWGYALLVGALLAPTLAALFWKRATSEGAIVAMVVGGAIQLGLTISRTLPPPWQPLFVSLPASVIALVVVSLLTKPPAPEKVDPFFEDDIVNPGKFQSKSA